MISNGEVGGASSAVGGGDFMSGFAAAGVAQAVTPGLGRISGERFVPHRLVANTLIGGVTTELGGGEFANGAKTFAFSQMFTESANYYENAVGGNANPLPGENRRSQTDYPPDKDTGRQQPADQRKRMNIWLRPDQPV